MKLWLVRHALAADRETFEGPDAERPLTPKGRKRFRQFAKWLIAQAGPPEVVVSSPLVRAVETATILCKAAGIKKKMLIQSDALAPGAEARGMIELARAHAGECLAFVGHEPDFSRCLSKLVGGGDFDFGKGFVAAVDFPEAFEVGAGRIYWLVGPRLRRVAAQAPEVALKS